MTILETHILINSHIYWLKYHSVQIQQQDLWRVATRKGQQVSPCVLELFARRYNTVYRHNMTFEVSLLFWNLCECNIYCSLLIVYFTFVYPFHLLWQCKHMFPMPVKPLELNWERERESKTERVCVGCCCTDSHFSVVLLTLLWISVECLYFVVASMWP